MSNNRSSTSSWKSILYIVEMLKEEIFPIVTVVVHTYNQDKFISQCLESILEQDSFSKMAILVIDDCSTDQTIKICKSYQEKFPEQMQLVTLPFNEFSRGNLVGFDCYASVKSKYIAWCDGDDYWVDISKISKQIEILEENPVIGIVHSDYLVSRLTSKGLEIKNRPKSEIDKAKKIMEGKDLVHGNYIKHSTAMIVTQAIDFDFVGASRGIYAGDWLTCISAAQHRSIHFIFDKTTVVRVTDEGMWNGVSTNTHREQKTKVRWYCAAQLPESELRQLFRQRVFADWVRDFIASSGAYKIVRPLVQFSRKIRGYMSLLWKTIRNFGK
jgi:glycosyltransferase involved in cell wall biosynthesis